MPALLLSGGGEGRCSWEELGVPRWSPGSWEALCIWRDGGGLDFGRSVSGPETLPRIRLHRAGLLVWGQCKAPQLHIFPLAGQS